jgi:hypothetical protein
VSRHFAWGLDVLRRGRCRDTAAGPGPGDEALAVEQPGHRQAGGAVDREQAAGQGGDQSASSSRWVVRKTVTPRSRSPAIMPCTSCAATGSSPEAGSSRNITAGAATGPAPPAAAGPGQAPGQVVHPVGEAHRRQRLRYPVLPPVPARHLPLARKSARLHPPVVSVLSSIE